MPKTTEKDFICFKNRFLEWCEFWGLKEWRLGVAHAEPDDDTKDFLAWTTIDLDSMQIAGWLSKEWGARDGVSEKAIEFSSQHEGLEALLAEFDTLAKDRSTDKQLDRSRHAVISRIENTYGIIMKCLYQLYPEANRNPNKILEILKKKSRFTP